MTDKLPVIFRKFKPRKEFDEEGGDIIALFPTLPGTNEYDITSYQHIGQHGSASADLTDVTVLAKPSEYADLLKELKQVGYHNLDVRDRFPSNSFELRRREMRYTAGEARPKKAAKKRTAHKTATSRTLGGMR